MKFKFRKKSIKKEILICQSYINNRFSHVAQRDPKQNKIMTDSSLKIASKDNDFVIGQIFGLIVYMVCRNKKQQQKIDLKINY